jgi:molybdopterin-containing oxidoreductase family iron-sulfur binding subunit
MERSRRHFLKLAGIAALGLTTKPVLDAFAKEHGGEEHLQMVVKKGEKALQAKQWAMVIDTREIHSAEDLEPMIEACHKIHNVPKFENIHHEVKWLWEEEYKHAFPEKINDYLNEEIEHKPFLVLCNHCENPACVRASDQSDLQKGK